MKGISNCDRIRRKQFIEQPSFHFREGPPIGFVSILPWYTAFVRFLLETALSDLSCHGQVSL